MAWTACLLGVGAGRLNTAPAGHSSVKQGELDHSVDNKKIEKKREKEKRNKRMKQKCERLGTKQSPAGKTEWGWKGRAAGGGATQNQQEKKEIQKKKNRNRKKKDRKNQKKKKKQALGCKTGATNLKPQLVCVCLCVLYVVIVVLMWMEKH